jgi:hypothetical protein
MQGMDRAVAAAEARQAMPDRVARHECRLPGRVRERQPGGQPGGEGG